MKIAITGYSGAGKSTLAKALGEIHHCPVLYLDTVQFEAGWRERDRDEAKAIVKAFMEKDNWIIDGNYTNFYHRERLSMADQIVFMNFPRLTCLYRACKRYVQNRNRTRESMADGCNEKLDWEFAKWVLVDGRNKARRANHQNAIDTYPSKTIVLKNPREVAAFLKEQENFFKFQ